MSNVMTVVRNRITQCVSAGLLVLAWLLLAPPAVSGAATIVIYNADPPGVGFNDPTPATPVGFNRGTTVGQQRLIAFQFAADVWGATLTSATVIKIRATWERLDCWPDRAVLGSAGANDVHHDFPGALFTGSWYPAALADKLSGSDRDPGEPDIIARFNVAIGESGCFEGAYWYYGLDNNHGDGLNLVTVLLHELAHGLGFQTFTNTATGRQHSDDIGEWPSVYDRFLFDNASGKTWAEMTDAERQASAVNDGGLAWNGPAVTSHVPGVLTGGVDQAGRALMFSPEEVNEGASVSHWDTDASPNQLMEPFIRPDTTQGVTPPQDLTSALLADLGWGAFNRPPSLTSAAQFQIFADQILPEGGSTKESAVRFRATISDPDGDPVKLQVELRPTSEPFTGLPTIESGLAHTAQVTLTRLGLDYDNYKWACRAVDAGGRASPWVEFGSAGNTDFSRVRIVNDYVRIDEIYQREEGGTPYIYVRWTLLRKWNSAAVAVYPSLNDNLPSTALSSVFEPLFMGGNSVAYFDFGSLGMGLGQGFYMWKPVGGQCNTARLGPEEYTAGNQYTTRFPRVFDMATFTWVDASQIGPAANLRFTIYDRTHFDARVCGIDFREAFPDSTDYHLGQFSGLNLAANDPAVVNQFRIFADAALPEGHDTTESAVRFRATLSDPDGDRVKFQVELRPTSEPFTGTPTIESALLDSGSLATVTQTGVGFGDYKWACRAVDAGGRASPWVEFGLAGNRDFRGFTSRTRTSGSTRSTGARRAGRHTSTSAGPSSGSGATGPRPSPSTHL